MKIFYGVQGTGNGHITRAREMARALRVAGAEVTWLFSGRAEQDYFDMEVFDDYRCRKGLTFQVSNGAIQYLQTARDIHPVQMITEIRSLDLQPYDLIITDFEPVTAWAARMQKLPVVGIGHQYAFQYRIPRAGDNPVANAIMRNFAPVTQGIGLHWSDFSQPILPPIVDPGQSSDEIDQRKVLVYLPFERHQDIEWLLEPFDRYRFVVYTPNPQPGSLEHVTVRPVSRVGFQEDLRSAAGVICNAGFELPSECLLQGKKILVKPVKGQMEQLSNALALEQLGYGLQMNSLDRKKLGGWLLEPDAIKVSYPDVAAHLADWIIRGADPGDRAWMAEVWQSVAVSSVSVTSPSVSAAV